MNKGLMWAVVAVCLLGFLILVGSSSEDKTECASCPPAAELEDAICAYKEGKIIRSIQPELNAVYITPLAEQQLGYNDLQTLGYIAACYSAYIKGNNLVWVEIYSHNTNKKLAKYSQSYGFKLYE